MDNNQNNYNDPYSTNSSPSYYQTPNQAYNQAYNSSEQPKRKNVAAMVLSIVSMVCGILSLVFCWAYGVYIIFAIAGLITRNIAVKKSNGQPGNMAKAGFITSLIGLILNIIAIVVWIIIFAIALSNGADINTSFYNEYYY